MPQAPSPDAYPEAREFMDRTLASPKGMRAKFPDRSHASVFRNRCYALRVKQRNKSMRNRSADDEQYNTSPWDVITFHFRETLDEEKKIVLSCDLLAVHDPEAAAAALLIMEEIT